MYEYDLEHVSFEKKHTKDFPEHPRQTRLEALKSLREQANASATTPGIIPGSINPPKEHFNVP
jgi:hypothetical protein